MDLHTFEGFLRSTAISLKPLTLTLAFRRRSRRRSGRRKRKRRRVWRRLRRAASPGGWGSAVPGKLHGTCGVPQTDGTASSAKGHVQWPGVSHNEGKTKNGAQEEGLVGGLRWFGPTVLVPGLACGPDLGPVASDLLLRFQLFWRCPSSK